MSFRHYVYIAIFVLAAIAFVYVIVFTDPWISPEEGEIIQQTWGMR